jgi:tetratricopeptide (TPR) repeat protein
MASSALGEALRRHPVSFRVGIGLVVLAASLAAIVLNRHTPPKKASTIEARLELCAGEVTLKEGALSPTVISGIPLPTGAELATGKGARALVRLSDGSAVFLRGDAQIVLESRGVDLRQGEIWLDAPPSERGGLTHKLGEVTVSAADAGLSMKHVGADVSVYVTRGLAVVEAPGGRVEVNAGEQATIAGGAAPKVVPLTYWDDWTGGMGDHRPLSGEGSGSGRIYGVDRSALAGTPARTLEISKQAVRAVIRDGMAETEVDQTFSNPGGREVEGWYWFTVPERAMVTSFAVETDGNLVEGEVIEKQEAAAKYAAAVRARHEPALLEWINGRSYRARIFPVPASGSRRVVLRYLELCSTQAGKLEYVYPLRSPENEPITIGELSLSVDLGDAGVGMPLSTVADAVIEEGGRRVTMRRSGYAPRADFQLEGQLRAEGGPFRVARFSAGGDRADYVMARYVPDVDWTGIKEQPGDLAVVVDTSASADESARQQKAAAAEAILRALSPSDHFTLIALDSTPTVLYPKAGLAEASEKEIAAALERLAEHATGGATDLGALFDAALGRVHGTEQPAVIYIGDGLATSGEVSADKLAERLRRSLAVSRARFFTVAVGPDANHALLRELSRAGGGQSFRIDDVQGASSEVLRLASAIKTPTITDLTIELGAGLDEPMLTSSGKLSRGEEVIFLARTHHPLPPTAQVKGRLGGKDFSKDYRIEIDAGLGAAMVPRLWAMEKVRRLLGEASDPEEHRGKVVELGLDYGLVTPFTSILALESEQAYQQQGIRRRSSPLRGIKLTRMSFAEERSALAALEPPVAVAAMGCSKDEAPAVNQAAPPMGGARAQAQEQGPMGAGEKDMAAAPAATAFAAADPAAVAEPPPPPPAPGAFAAGASKAKVADESDGVPGVMGLAAKGDMPMPVAAVPAREEKPTGGPTYRPPVIQARPAAPKQPVIADNKKELLVAPLVKARPEAPRPAPPKASPVLGNCSDTAKRPLAERIVVWASRLRRATTVEELIARYDGARSTCELPDWRAQSALLQLIQAKIRTEGAAEALLQHFASERETQRFIAHGILRRTVDARIVAAVRRVLFQDKARWTEVDNDLAAIASPAERVAHLRQVLLSYPDDPDGEIRLVRLLSEANQKEEAQVLGHRLRDRGFMSPGLALDLGDVLAQNGFEEDAIRTYSEIVEFDPQNPDSRRLLGDVYLRHGWYPAAYRQYKTLTDITPGEATGLLRLAAAAAGSGRVDEALRLQRQVESAEGIPGPNDPRAWSRLLSAARLGRLLADPKAPAGQAESVSRKLKELQLWSGPAAYVILTWEDYGAALSLLSMEGDKESPSGEASEAIPVGLSAVLVSVGDLERLRWVVRWKNDPPKRSVDFVIHTLIWDGKSFKVTVRPGSLAAKDRELKL